MNSAENDLTPAFTADIASRWRRAITSASPMESNTKAVFGYVYGLDALRLFAVSIVIIRHYELVMLLPGGFGVSVFFFISGFLISRLIIAEEKARGTIGLRNFYARRMIRLLPPLLLMGVVAVPALWWIDPKSFAPGQVASSFLYLGNIYKIGTYIFDWRQGYKALEPLWSLAVEEHFYLLLPLVLVAVRSARGRIIMMVAAIIGALALRILVGVIDPANADQINYHFTFSRLDAIAWGVLLTLLLDQGYIGRRLLDDYGMPLFLVGLVAVTLSMVHWSKFYEETVKYTPQSVAIGIVFSALIFSSKLDFVRRITEWKMFSYLGSISYEMYLWHFPIWTVVLYFIPGRICSAAASIALTLLVSDCAYRMTTKQLVGVRKRFGGHPV